MLRGSAPPRTDHPDTGRGASLVVCGILRREVEWLVERHRWPVDAVFLPSRLHMDFEGLAAGLEDALARQRDRRPIVVCGVCHPRIDALLEPFGAVRTPAQNCISLLLGSERFTTELSRGAYFLLREWAENWEEISRLTFGPDTEMAGRILRGEHSHVACVRTPCSGDYTAAAEAVGAVTGLPLRWLDTDLASLDAALSEALRSAGVETHDE